MFGLESIWFVAQLNFICMWMDGCSIQFNFIILPSTLVPLDGQLVNLLLTSNGAWVNVSYGASIGILWSIGICLFLSDGPSL
jgi:hypothetical protein